MAAGYPVKKARVRLFQFVALFCCVILEFVAWLTIRRAVKTLHTHIAELQKSNIPLLNNELLAVLVIGEDHRFFYHKGVDPVAVVRACFSICRGMRQGGSTIEQQLVRTLTGDYRYTLSRKVKEALLAVTVNRMLSKTDIAALYLSIAYFGYRLQGIDSACLGLGIVLPGDTRQYSRLISCLKYPIKKTYCEEHQRRCERRSLYIERNLPRFRKWLPLHSFPSTDDFHDCMRNLHDKLFT
jgi:hypothetical protein